MQDQRQPTSCRSRLVLVGTVQYFASSVTCCWHQSRWQVLSLPLHTAFASSTGSCIINLHVHIDVLSTCRCRTVYTLQGKTLLMLSTARPPMSPIPRLGFNPRLTACTQFLPTAPNRLTPKGKFCKAARGI
ncbi:hypothetical protein NX059_002344 [Plenodomus lindquistii]|nr:hypothetical protein NX059_002344 [Plenodomus lindquistii]